MLAQITLPVDNKDEVAPLTITGSKTKVIYLVTSVSQLSFSIVIHK